MSHFTKIVIYKKSTNQWEVGSFSKLDFSPLYFSKFYFSLECLHWWSSMPVLVFSYRVTINTKNSQRLSYLGFLKECSSDPFSWSSLESWKDTYLKTQVLETHLEVNYTQSQGRWSRISTFKNFFSGWFLWPLKSEWILVL